MVRAQKVLLTPKSCYGNEEFMDNNMRAEQIEAVITAADYCKRLVTAINNLIYEFENGRLEDTPQYAKDVLDGINWVIQVYNATKELFAETGVVVDEDRMNRDVVRLAAAYDNNDDAEKAAVLGGGILDFVNSVIEAGGRLN